MRDEQKYPMPPWGTDVVVQVSDSGLKHTYDGVLQQGEDDTVVFIGEEPILVECIDYIRSREEHARNYGDLPKVE